MMTFLIIAFFVIFIGGLAFSFGQTTYEVGTGRPVGASQIDPVTGLPYEDPGTVVVGPAGPPAGTPGSTATPDFQQNFINTLIHPKVLGLIVTMLIASVTIYFLSSG
jgi:hypothetical protein